MEDRRKRKKRAATHLRVAGVAGLGYGISAYGSPIGNVTGVDMPVMGPQFPGGGGPCADQGGSGDSGGGTGDGGGSAP